MNNRWSISILMPIFLVHSTCHTASIIRYDSEDKKDISTLTSLDQTPYDDTIHWRIIVSCLEKNPDVPIQEGCTIFSLERDTSRSIVSLRNNLLIGRKEQTPDQCLQAERLANAIKPSLMKKSSKLWQTGEDLFFAQTRLSLLQQGKIRNLLLEAKTQKTIKILEAKIAQCATQKMIQCLAQYVADPQTLENILQEKTS